MVAKIITITFEGEAVEGSGVPVDGLVNALRGLQDALRMTVGHLGGYQHGQGPPPKWIRDQSRLAVRATRPGSLIAELELIPGSTPSFAGEHLGSQALDMLMLEHGSSHPEIPDSALEKLESIPRSLPDGVEVWLGDEEIPRRVMVSRRAGRRGRTNSAGETAHLYGWLNAVNWNRGTAQLHRYRQSHVPLRFGSPLHEQMLSCATNFVEVKGKGKFNSKSQWQYVQVDEIRNAGVSNRPFDLETFRANSDPKAFDPDKVVRASEPFDSEVLIQYINQAREDR